VHQIVVNLPGSAAVDGALSANRLVSRTHKAAIALLLAAVLGVGGLALSVDFRARLIVPDDGRSALIAPLIGMLRGL
jgi:hypothetical protein